MTETYAIDSVWAYCGDDIDASAPAAMLVSLARMYCIILSDCHISEDEVGAPTPTLCRNRLSLISRRL